MLNETKRLSRERLVLDHFHDEVSHQWDDVLSTFPHPHYELIPLMIVHDGDSDVRDYYHDTRVAFPDQHHELISLRHSDDAVIVEFWLKGTHKGPLGAIPPTGSTFRLRVMAFFIFEKDEKLVCERIYFDTLTMFKQLFGSLNYKNPKNWLLLLRAIRGLGKTGGSKPAPSLVNTTPPSFPHYTHVPLAQRQAPANY